MTRSSKFPAKIAFSFCTLFCLYSPFVFSQQVDTAWVRRYNGPGNGDDKAVAIAVDTGGNVYVTGSSFDSTTDYDYCTIKYLPNGDTGWVRRYDGPPSKNDTPTALGLDNEGNVLVTGKSVIVYNQISTYNEGFATIKYDPEGNLLWIRTSYFATEYSTGGAYALAIDKQNNVYVTGELFDVLGGSLWITLKYDPDGNGGWDTFESNSNPSLPYGIAVDNEENVFVIHADSTIKYDSFGNRVWVRGFPVLNGIIRAVALDRNENVYAVGGPGATITAKYDSSGNQLWVRVRHFDFGGGPARGGFALTLDTLGGVAAFGDAWDVEAAITFLVKYDSLGNELWFYYGSFADFDYPPTILTSDINNNIYLTWQGCFTTSKFNSQGDEIWRTSYAPYYPCSQSSAVATDSRSNVYVTGFIPDTGIGTDYLTIKYSPLPQLKGDLNLDGVLGLQDVVYAVNYTFAGELPPAAPSACDINCDGKVTPADVVVLLRMVFSSEPAPC